MTTPLDYLGNAMVAGDPYLVIAKPWWLDTTNTRAAMAAGDRVAFSLPSGIAYPWSNVLTGPVLAVSRGGTGTGIAFSQGSVVFAGSSGVYSQNNSKLFWDNVNNWLGIGTASPGSNLELKGYGASDTTSPITAKNSAGNRLFTCTNDGRFYIGGGSGSAGAAGLFVDITSGALGAAGMPIVAMFKDSAGTLQLGGNYFVSDASTFGFGPNGAGSAFLCRNIYNYNIIASGDGASTAKGRLGIGIGSNRDPATTLEVQGRQDIVHLYAKGYTSQTALLAQIEATVDGGITFYDALKISNPGDLTAARDITAVRDTVATRDLLASRTLNVTGTSDAVRWYGKGHTTQSSLLARMEATNDGGSTWYDALSLNNNGDLAITGGLTSGGSVTAAVHLLGPDLAVFSNSTANTNKSGALYGVRYSQTTTRDIDLISYQSFTGNADVLVGGAKHTALWLRAAASVSGSAVNMVRLDTTGLVLENGVSSAPSACNLLEVNSTTQLSRPWPVLTTTERTGVGSPTVGSATYDSTTDSLWIRTSGGGWKEVAFV